MMGEWIIVGAGLSGAVAARVLAEKGGRCRVVDRRASVAGNAADPLHASGVQIHSYGPHAFHTNSERVWKFLSKFTEWRHYEHRVLASVDGEVIPLPVNFVTVEKLFPEKAETFIDLITKLYPDQSNIPIMSLRSSISEDIRILAEGLYKKVFLDYTRKQWGLEPEQLGPSVMSRVPVRLSRDDRYFTDHFQGIPRDGYVRLVENILDHPRIGVELNDDINALDNRLTRQKSIYTGSLDELCDYSLGVLPYRSLRFKHSLHNKEYALASGQLNFPGLESWTRIYESKWLTGQKHESTVLVQEFPLQHEPHATEPFYPIPLPGNRELHKQYQALVSDKFPDMTTFGRLADYRYYNMDQAVARALQVSEAISK